MKSFGRIIWMLALALLFPDSLWGGTSPAHLLMEAVSVMVAPWDYGQTGEAGENEAVPEAVENSVADGEETGTEETVNSLTGAGVAAVVDNLAGSAETNGQEAEEDETGIAEDEEAFSVAEAAYSCYTSEELSDTDFLLSNIFCVDSSTTSEGIDWDANQFLTEDFSLEKSSEPQILIYHTHSQEAYADSASGEAGETVQGVGEELARLLRETYGYQVVHNTTTFDMVDGELDRSRAYSYAQDWLEEYLEENPSIEVIIDLHRDSVGEDNRLVTEIDGKQTAQIMLFNGLSRTSRGSIESLYNPYLQDNLAFSFQLRMVGDSLYPSLYRRIYLKGYRYNLHYRARSLLVEVGAQNNTYQEAVNAMEPFARLLDLILSSGG
ncbi:MAG: stage II sporulation protein P [Lachnospiraceae bacterium]|nr:stage II sporulation protein P [Lachnospiraceae bacterium]